MINGRGKEVGRTGRIYKKTHAFLTMGIMRSGQVNVVL